MSRGPLSHSLLSSFHSVDPSSSEAYSPRQMNENVTVVGRLNSDKLNERVGGGEWKRLYAEGVGRLQAELELAKHTLYLSYFVLSQCY